MPRTSLCLPRFLPVYPPTPLCRAHNSRETTSWRTLDNRRNNRRRSERIVYKIKTYLSRIVAVPNCLSLYLFSFSGAVSDNLCHRPLNVTYRRRLVYILNSTCSSLANIEVAKLRQESRDVPSDLFILYCSELHCLYNKMFMRDSFAYIVRLLFIFLHSV